MLWLAHLILQRSDRWACCYTHSRRSVLARVNVVTSVDGDAYAFDDALLSDELTEPTVFSDAEARTSPNALASRHSNLFSFPVVSHTPASDARTRGLPRKTDCARGPSLARSSSRVLAKQRGPAPVLRWDRWDTCGVLNLVSGLDIDPGSRNVHTPRAS